MLSRSHASPAVINNLIDGITSKLSTASLILGISLFSSGAFCIK